MRAMSVAQSSEARGDLVVRAVAEPRGIWLGTIVTIPGWIVLAIGITSSVPAGVLLGTAVYVAVLVLARWSMRHMTTRHLTVREGRLTETTMYRTRVISPDRAIARAVRAEYVSDRLTGQVGKVLLLLDDSGRTVFRIFPAVWDAEMARLPAALGVTEQTRSGQTSAKQLRREVPGSVPWGEAHMIQATLLFLAVVCAIVAAIASL
jgi:hypothetical protein